MSFTLKKIYSSVFFGIEGNMITVECQTSVGMPTFDIVGLPSAEVKESRERIKAALRSCGFKALNKAVIINLAPANIKKEGTTLDLALFMAVIAADKNLEADFEHMCFIGELSLGGDVNGVDGVLPMCLNAKKNGFNKFFVPYNNAKEASLAGDVEIYPVKNIIDVYNHITENELIKPIVFSMFDFNKLEAKHNEDFKDVKGQFLVRRAIEVAAVGAHNLLLIGPPGTGKSMISKRIRTIIPELTFEEAVETTKVYSATGMMRENPELILTRPFFSPHHSVSRAGLAGGGSDVKSGAITSAHNGIIFLDELPEFSKDTLEALRQPLENGDITISRAAGSITYPCNFMLVSAMNPCKCGYFGHPTKKCVCTQNDRKNYLSKISGPLLDRIDIQVEVTPISFDDLSSKERGESSSDIKHRVEKARKYMKDRISSMNWGDKKIPLSNARIEPGDVFRLCEMDEEAKKILKVAFEKHNFSARGYDRVLKIARSIADLEECEIINKGHIAEAVIYRTLDKKYWNN